MNNLVATEPIISGYRTQATGSHDDCVALRFVDMPRNSLAGEPTRERTWYELFGVENLPGRLQNEVGLAGLPRTISCSDRWRAPSAAKDLHIQQFQLHIGEIFRQRCCISHRPYALSEPSQGIRIFACRFPQKVFIGGTRYSGRTRAAWHPPGYRCARNIH